MMIFVFLYLLQSFCIAVHTLALFCNSPHHFSPSLFCSSDCDELSHLKCFLSLCVLGGFQSPSIFPSPPPPSTESPHFLCTDIFILYLIAVVSSISPYLFYACLSLPVSISVPTPFLYSESTTQITIILSDLPPPPPPKPCSK